MRERREAYARLPLIEERVEEGATLLRYRDEPGVEAALRRLVGLEDECCPGIDFTLTRQEGVVTLRVAA